MAWQDFGLRNGPHSSFDSPRRDAASCTWLIRSSAQTLCDDLARAAEAKDGKKNSEDLVFGSKVRAVLHRDGGHWKGDQDFPLLSLDRLLQ